MSKAFNGGDGTLYFPPDEHGNVVGEIFTGHTVQGREVGVSIVQHGNIEFDSGGISQTALGTNCYDIIYSSVSVFGVFNDNRNIGLQLPVINKDSLAQQVQLAVSSDGTIRVRRRANTNALQVRAYIVYTKRTAADRARGDAVANQAQ